MNIAKYIKYANILALTTLLLGSALNLSIYGFPGLLELLGSLIPIINVIFTLSAFKADTVTDKIGALVFNIISVLFYGFTVWMFLKNISELPTSLFLAIGLMIFYLFIFTINIIFLAAQIKDIKKATNKGHVTH